ncbi:hypothetical protein [Bifidobacterium samirii]|uniref:hypothetical protein n=1 Tax=Bifidobacterium samirii TaxID=2306974 RepID=UPI000F7EC272|nr:hypothetical protein [Bifidobacterium samirii]
MTPEYATFPTSPADRQRLQLNRESLQHGNLPADRNGFTTMVAGFRGKAGHRYGSSFVIMAEYTVNRHGYPHRLIAPTAGNKKTTTLPDTTVRTIAHRNIPVFRRHASHPGYRPESVQNDSDRKTEKR